METLRAFCENIYNIDWSTYSMYAITLYAFRLFMEMVIYMIADKFQLMENTIIRKTIEGTSNTEKLDKSINKTILLQFIPVIGFLMLIIDICIILDDLNERLVKNVMSKTNNYEHKKKT